MWHDKAYHIILILLRRLSGLGLVIFSTVMVLALFSFDADDPSFNSASTEDYISNWMGEFGSHIADLTFQLIGVSGFFLALILFSIGSRMMSRQGTRHLLPKLIVIPFCILCFSTFFAIFPQPDWWSLS